MENLLCQPNTLFPSPSRPVHRLTAGAETVLRAWSANALVPRGSPPARSQRGQERSREVVPVRRTSCPQRARRPPVRAGAKARDKVALPSGGRASAWQLPQAVDQGLSRGGRAG